MKNSNYRRKIMAFCLSAALSLNTLGFSAFAADVQTANTYNIVNPYENVDWSSFGQYKAAFHTHSTNSDGSNTREAVIEDHYAKGFDILTMGDHDTTTITWDQPGYGRGVGANNPGIGAMSSARAAEIEAGLHRNGKGMINVDYSNEQSATAHIMTFWADFNNTARGNMPVFEKMAETIRTAEVLGGISHINHPGRETGGSNANDAVSIAASNNPATVRNYVDLFMGYPSLVGMEIVNKIDNESKSDRILWDNILKQTMPEGRFVWGFSNDDSHSINATGYSWNVMLMPELNQSETRNAMETGAFYAVSRVDRLEGINRYRPNGVQVPGSGDANTLYLFNQRTPGISNIEVNGSIITITGADYDVIEWISGVDDSGRSKVIAQGASIDVSLYADVIENNYVRAHLKSDTGIAYTQPFGIEETDLISVDLMAFVEKFNGNKNALTITVTEIYSNGLVYDITETFSINNNAEGVYAVGRYNVYVDTKGNQQIRQCYIIE